MPGSPVADIRSSFGAAFIGLLVSTALFGLTIAQTWTYFWHYRNKDPKLLRFFIAFVTIMDGFHTVLCAYVIYWYLILNLGNVENLRSSTWVMSFQIIISIIVGASVEFYYARRVYILSQSIICPIIIVVLVAIASFFGIFFTMKEAVLKRFSAFHALTWISCSGMAAGALADLLVAAATCRSLYHRKTGTDSTITTLMAYSINSGLLTGILGTAMTVSFVVSPSSLTWLAFFWVMSRCYVNSLLALLNSRDYLRGRSIPGNLELDNAYDVSSIRVISGPSSGAGIFLSAYRPTTLDFGRNKSGYDEGLDPKVPKPVYFTGS
ncbi:hypothetical protein H4582DRAFT_2076647 [Lactarius indigo]|nr:hypothetical protein H4582DRAFT_2076647 [Lactarius indigo]